MQLLLFHLDYCEWEWLETIGNVWRNHPCFVIYQQHDIFLSCNGSSLC